MRTERVELVRFPGRAVGITFSTVLAIIGLAVFGCGDSESRGDREVTRTAPAVQPSQSTQQTVSRSTPSTGEVAMTETDESDDSASEVEMQEPEEPVLQDVSFEDGDRAYHERRYGDAVEVFSVYTEEHPDNPWGYYMLGLSSWKDGQLERSEQALEVALSKDSTHVKSLVNLGRVLLEQGRPEDALTRVEKAVELEESGSALRVLARARYELGQEDEAIDAYRRALVSDPEDAWSMNNLGLIYIRNGEYEEALRPLARATELRSDVAVFQNNLGMALERTGHIEEAQKAYAQAVDLDSDYEKALANLTRVEVLESDPETESIDLTELARRFTQEVEGWREAMAGGPEPVESDSTDVGEDVETSIGEEGSVLIPLEKQSPPPGQGR